MAGAVEVDTTDASRPVRLGFEDDGPPAEGSFDAAVAAVRGALDSFLDGAQRDQADLAALGAVWLEEADPTAAETLRTGLTTGDNPVQAATYAMNVQVEPDPTLVAVHTTVVRRDGSSVDLELVFDVTGDAPRLQLVGAPGAA